MINCSPAKNFSYSTKLTSKIKQTQLNKLMAKQSKLDQLTPVSSPEQNTQRSSPLCPKMEFDDDFEEDSHSSKSDKMCNNQTSRLVVKSENKYLKDQNEQNVQNQATIPQSPLSNNSSPSPKETNKTSKNNSPSLSPNDRSSPNQINSNGNLNFSTNEITNQLAAQINSPNSPAVSVSSTCSSLNNSNANATPHGINDILKKHSAENSNNSTTPVSSTNASTNNSNSLIDNQLSVFAAVASAAAINNNNLASTFTNTASKLPANGNQLAHATSALAAAVAANRFYSSNLTPTTNTVLGLQSQLNKTANQSVNNNNNNNTGSNSTNTTVPPRNQLNPLNNAAALKLDLSSRQFYWQQMVQNQALWQERFSAAVNNVANGTTNNANNNAYSNLNSPLVNHCNGQTTPGQTPNLDSSFNCKFVFIIFLIYLSSIFFSNLF